MIGGRVTQSSAATNRFGRDLDPEWTYGPTYRGTISASWTPPAWSFTSLISVPVSTDKSSYVYGYYITTEEPNVFWVCWWRQGTLYYNSVEVPMGGTIIFEDSIPVNNGFPANRLAGDSSVNAYIYIFATVENTNVTTYQGGLLIADEDVEDTSKYGLYV